MQYNIHGTTMQALEIELAPGEQVYSQTHTMAWMTDGISMQTNSGGGLFAGLKRSMTGGTFFVTTYAATSGPAMVAFASKFPGKIMPLELKGDQALICRKESFLCAQSTVTVDIAFQRRLGAGFFAGEGFVLQHVKGPGTVWLDLSGEVVMKELAVGQRLLVHAGHIGMQTPQVTTDIQMVGGFRNMLFGGEGLFLATVTGPGKVWLQSMPLLNLAESLAPYMGVGAQQPASPMQQVAGDMGIGGGILGGLAGMFGRDL